MNASSTKLGVAEQPPRLSLLVKLVYGLGDWGMSSFGTLRQIFYAIFLTDVVRLNPILASFAALIGVIWDAINDPLVGMLSDRVHTRWGRRRPFLLFFSIPFALGFVFLWWTPPFDSQVARMVVVTFAYMLSDTFQTLLTVPFFALTPEITPDYDERTTLTGYRMFFNLLASLATAVAAPMIVDMAVKAGYTQQQGYLANAALFGGLAAIPFLLIFFVVRERYHHDASALTQVPLPETLKTAWSNIPFRFATAIYMLNWITFDLVALILPYFLVYWLAQGNLLASVSIAGMELPIESAVLGLLILTAVLAVPLWLFLSKRLNKRDAYIIGLSFWAFVQLLIFALQPGQISLVLVLAVLAGIGVSTAHVLPDAIFPDVIEWDELRTRRRQEGIYYGVKNFVRKLTGAISIFLALQVLGWFGYVNPPPGAVQFSQPASALTAIRWMTGPVGAALLLTAIATAWFYPLTRQRHARIRRLLQRRRERAKM
jgi:GPH family glycoside/pentoside/hexuronide:cation symporter